MLSIGKALQGGDSRWVSSVTIHNELLRRGRKVAFIDLHFRKTLLKA